jgi:hypothetical protein
MSKFEKFCRPITHTTLAYHLACFIFKHKLWGLCHWVEGVPNEFWGGEYRGWVFLSRYHPADDSVLLMNVPDDL